MGLGRKPSPPGHSVLYSAVRRHTVTIIVFILKTLSADGKIAKYLQIYRSLTCIFVTFTRN